MSDAIQGQNVSTRGRMNGRTLIFIGLALCIIPYLISIGLPVYLVGAVRVLKSDQGLVKKVIGVTVSFAVLVGYYTYLLSLPGW
jgi:hypothetical protein